MVKKTKEVSSMCNVCGDPDCYGQYCCETKDKLGCDYCKKEGCIDRDEEYQPDPGKSSI